MTKIASAVFLRNGSLLVVRRAAHRVWRPDHWDIVGGNVESGETIEAALIREAQEEVGLTPTEFYLHSQFTASESADTAHYYVYAVTGWEGGEPRLVNDEHSELKWLKREEALLLNNIALHRYVDIFTRMPIG